MATLVLAAAGAAVGSAIGGSFAGLGLAAVGGGIGAGALGAAIGQSAGGLAGAYVDQLIINALFPQVAKGPRATSFPDVQSGDGSPINYPIGSRVRLPCVPIWMSDIRERRKTQGGKGGGSKVRTYTYYRDVAFHLAGRPIRSVRKIIAEGDTLFEYDGNEPQQNQDGGGFSLVATDDQGRISVVVSIYTYFEDTQTERRIERGLITSQTQSGGPNLTQFVAGSGLTITGFSAGENNTPATVIASGTNPDGSTWILCDHGNDGDTGWTEESPGIGQVISIQQQTRGSDPNLVSDVFFHLGDQTTPNAYIESIEGVGSSPVWFGDSYVVMQNVSISRFGNRVPFFEAIVEADTFTTLDFAIDALMGLAGIPAANFDVTAISSIPFIGYNFQGIAQPSAALAQFMQFYDVAARWSQDVLTFFPAKDRPIVSIRSDDLGAAVGTNNDGGQPMLVESVDQAEVTIPTAVSVSYLEETLNLSKGTQTYSRAGSPFDGSQEVSMPIGSNAETARVAARRILWDGGNARTVFRATLPADDLGLAVEENDRVRFSARGRDYDFIVARTTRDEPGVVELIGPRTPARILGTDLLESYLYPPAPAADDPQGDEQRVPVIPRLQLIVIDCRPLVDDHAFSAGVYFGAGVFDPQNPFLGGELHVSTDGGTTFSPLASIEIEATMGILTTPFQNASATPRTIDTGESFNVRLFNPAFELESISEARMRDGENLAWVAGELIAFTDATLQGDGTYLIENVVRGVRGTEDYEVAHAAGSLFCLVDAQGIGFARVPLRELGTELRFRAISSGGLVSEAESFILDFQGNTLRPMPLANYLVSRDGADVISVSWDRQTRAVSDPLAVTETPVLQPPERYRITFDDGATVVEKSITDARSFVYGTAAQTADGFTPGDPIDIATREIGVVGDGPTSEVSLP